MPLLTSTRVASPEALLTGSPALPEPTIARRCRLFFLWLLLIPAIVYFATMPLVRSRSYERWGPSHWGPILDYAFSAHNINADVVVFGDSSAFLGIDPRLIEREVGISSVVLPNTVGSLPVTGDQALEDYLANNTRPRLIVLYFTAWDLDYNAATDTRLYEGEEMLLRHDTPAQIAAFALKHPMELPAFPLRNLSTVGPTILKTMLRGDDRGELTAAARGHVDDTESYPAVGADCTLPARDVAATGTSTAEALAAKYKRRGYDVALYLAPMPDCSNAPAIAARTYPDAAAPAVLAPSSFLGDGFYAHVEPAAVPVSSRLFAYFLRDKLAK